MASTPRQIYDHIAGYYDFLFGRVFRPGREEALRRLALRPGERVLEVGIGTGLTLPLYPRGVKVLGIDYSRRMLAEAQRRRTGLAALDAPELARMDAGCLALPGAVFDAVFAPYLVSVVPAPRLAVAEMARVCKPEGRVVILNHFRSETPAWRWLETSLTPLAEKTGFRLDLPVEAIQGLPGLTLEAECRVNLLKMWRVLVFRKTPARAAPGLPRTG